jgi:hypothetical protein
MDAEWRLEGWGALPVLARNRHCLHISYWQLTERFKAMLVLRHFLLDAENRACASPSRSENKMVYRYFTGPSIQ